MEDSSLDGNTIGVYHEISDGGVIARNRITRSSDQGIYVAASSGVSVQDNVLDGNAWGIVLHGLPRAEHPELSGNSVRGNVIARTAAADLVLFEGEGARDNASDGNVYLIHGRAPRLSRTRSSGYAVTHRDLRRFARDTGQERTSAVRDAARPGRAAGGVAP